MMDMTVYQARNGWCYKCPVCGPCGGGYRDRETAEAMAVAHAGLLHEKKS
jgi:MoaA/NifB/PqqE/SkfB family radical SAM enzyme